MCGIAGIIHFNGKPVSIETVKKMTDAIAHRGPDGDGHWLNPASNVCLGHRRLSIIDLSLRASQPMHYLDRYSITYNGEIYNYLELKDQLEKAGYKFHTSSDTEVILAAFDKYRSECVNHLDGMFAFVIWDEKEQEAFCARDRFGEKPFFYSVQDDRFIFGSEIKCFWEAGAYRQIDHNLLYNYLSDRAFVCDPNDGSRTFYSNIKKLEPAHCIYLKKGSVDIRKYWNIDLSVTTKISIDDAATRLRDMLSNSVSKRLRSDVPVGSSLSGGIDSSVIVCMIDQLRKQSSPRQLTFSARFADFEKDEGRYMELVTQQTKNEAKFVFVDEGMLAEDIEKLFYHQDEPTASASIFAQWCVMKLAAENNTKVLLDGQGADEMLAGYHYYFYTYYYELLRTDKIRFAEEVNSIKDRFPAIYAHFAPYLAAAPNVLKRSWNFAKRKISSAKPAQTQTMVQDAPFFSEEYKETKKIMAEEMQTLNENLRYNTCTFGLQDLLRYADRNSMAHGREVRLPYLDHKIAEFIFSLPASHKIHQGWTKYILRKGTEKMIPSEIAWRKDKIGYEPPQKKWMNSPRLNEMYRHASDRLESEKILNPARNRDKDDRWAILSAAHLFQ